MTLTPAKLALILLFLGGGVVWFARRDGASKAEAGDPGATPAAAASQRAQRSRLELAVTSAVNAAECGSTEVGYDRRTPEEAARRLVALMNTASAPPGGAAPTMEAADYVLGDPQRAWQVAVRVAPDGGALSIEGYGTDLEQPLLTRRVPCS